MIKGIVAAVPANVETNIGQAFIRMTGVVERRIVKNGTHNTHNLAVVAAQRLMANLEWVPEDISCIIFVTQTPVVRMPATACSFAHSLGCLCPSFDVNLACSGYVYGLWLASRVCAPGQRMLLVAGDTVSRMTAPGDRLFADAVTVTAIESPSTPSTRYFVLGTDGSGFGSLIADPLIRMDGAAVMTFALAAVPKLVAETTMNANVDYYLFHQANKLIIDCIAKKCKLPADRVPMNIARYGNTSSASIPLLMCDSECTEPLKQRGGRTVAMFGFGAGWSWGGALLRLDPLLCAEVVSV